jgi:hypothetical protein
MADDINVTIHSLLCELPASYSRLKEIRRKTAVCPELSKVKAYLLKGFPQRSPSWKLAVYRKVALDIIDADGVLLKDGRILIPIAMRPAMLALLHEGHPGLEKSKALARQTFWWPGLAREVETTVSPCAACCALRHKQPAETLILYTRGKRSA